MENKTLKRQRQKKYNASVKGVARQLRSNYGYSKEDSTYFARKCLNDYQRCEICGVSGWFLKTQKIFLQGNLKMNRRLQVDHIIPFNGMNSTKENTRILCHSCNYLRGPNRRTDKEVLQIVRRWYREKYYLKFLYWLNSEPNSGGQLFRNIYMQRKTLNLLGLNGLMDQMNLQIQMS